MQHITSVLRANQNNSMAQGESQASQTVLWCATGRNDCSIDFHKVVDARGTACPGRLLEAQKAIGSVKVGEILEVWSGDPNTKADVSR